eukprot:7379811-Prymnesium_polylepis.1
MTATCSRAARCGRRSPAPGRCRSDGGRARSRRARLISFFCMHLDLAPCLGRKHTATDQGICAGVS